MRPIVWCSRDLSSLYAMMRSLTRFIQHRAMVMSPVKHRQCPDTRIASSDKHERAVHQPRRPFPLPRLLCQAISGPILSSTVASEPDLCGAPWFLFCRGARRFHHDVVPVGFPPRLDGSHKTCSVWICSLWRRCHVESELGDILQVARGIEAQFGGVSHRAGAGHSHRECLSLPSC